MMTFFHGTRQLVTPPYPILLASFSGWSQLFPPLEWPCFCSLCFRRHSSLCRIEPHLIIGLGEGRCLSPRLVIAQRWGLQTTRELRWVVKSARYTYQSISSLSLKVFERHWKIHLVNSPLCSFLGFNIYLPIQSNIWWMPMGKKISHYEKQKDSSPPPALSTYFPSPNSHE